MAPRSGIRTAFNSFTRHLLTKRMSEPACALPSSGRLRAASKPLLCGAKADSLGRFGPIKLTLWGFGALLQAPKRYQRLLVCQNQRGLYMLVLLVVWGVLRSLLLLVSSSR